MAKLSLFSNADQSHLSLLRLCGKHVVVFELHSEEPIIFHDQKDFIDQVNIIEKD